MEYDRYKDHNKLYILGITCLILCLGFLFFSMYILPFLIWDLHYDNPEFISYLISFFEDKHYFSHSISTLFVWLIFFVPSLIAGIISYYISNRIDNQLFDVTPESTMQSNEQPIDIKEEFKESASFGLRILLLMIAVVLAILLLQTII